MRTRNSYFPNNSSVTIPRRRNKKRAPNVVEPELRTIIEIAPMADNRTIEELLQAPTEGYIEAIVIPEINADHFEIKTNFLQLTTYLKNEISRFTQRFEETFGEACKRFKEMLKACPHHEFTMLTQIDTFYNRLNENDQDSLNAAAGGNLLSKTTREDLNIIKNKSKVCYSRYKPNVFRMNTASKENASKTDDSIDKHADQISTLVDIVSNKVVTSATVKAVEESCVTCGGNHAYYNCDATNSNQLSVYAEMDALLLMPKFASTIKSLLSNKDKLFELAKIPLNENCSVMLLKKILEKLRDPGKFLIPCDFPRMDQGEVVKAKSSIEEPLKLELKYLPSHLEYAYLEGIDKLPVIIAKDLKDNEKEALLKVLKSHKRAIAWKITDIKGIDSRFCTHKILMEEDYKPAVQSQRWVNPKIHEVIKKEVTKLLDAGMIYPISDSPLVSPIHCVPKKGGITVVKNENNELIPTCFADALLLMPKFASMIKSLLTNKDKLFELAKIPLNENCSAMLLKKLPEKLRDPGKFLIPCDFSRMDVCHALADLGTSINLMPFSIWKKLSLPELTPTRMTLELADRSITRPKGVAKDVFVKWGNFTFRPILQLWILKPILVAFTFNLNQTTRYSSTYDDLSVNQIDIIDVAREEYAQEILEIDHADCDPKRDICLIEKLLNNDPFQLPPMDLKQGEVVKAKSSIEEPSKLELKGLPSHLEYAYLEGVDKLPVIIAKDLKVDEKEAILKVLKSHKRAIAWKITDIKGIDPRFCTYKILMEDDYKPAVQSQRRVNPKIHEVIKKEVIKLLEAGMIYPISDSPWVSPIHCVPKKGEITVVEIENNELIPTRLVTGWRVCIDYRKLNDATHKDHFPLPFMDQMLERLAGNEFYYFLDGFSGYIQIPINPPDQEKTTFTCLYGTFAYRIMPFGLCNSPGTFQRFIFIVPSHLDTMLQWCEDTNLVLNWEKCHFMVKEGIVLSHKISKNGLEVDRAKVDVIAKLPLPTTVKGVRSFLRHAGFYRRFIQDFSKIARPITHLLEKETPFVFSNDCIYAFETLKKKLTEDPILVVPDWNLPFELMCDASDFAIGVVLGQRKTKHFQPIHYSSKTMTEAQIHYTMMKKEMLVVVYAFEKFRPYLVLSKSIVYTDHSALKYLLSKQDAKYVRIKSFDGVCMAKKLMISSKLVMKDPPRAIMVPISPPRKEEYAQEFLGFFNDSSSGNPTSTFEPIISNSSPSLTPFEGSDFILEEIDAYLKDDPISSEIDHADCDPEGDICLIENMLNNDPFQLPLMDLKQGEAVKAKYSIEEPLKLELKELPCHLEYAYLEGVDKLPVIISKDLKVD
nr:reverse transcriptase domain-containing protein [Tanacetum cinerariifolium]